MGISIGACMQRAPAMLQRRPSAGMRPHVVTLNNTIDIHVYKV